MRFLIDNPLSPALSKLLNQAGHDAVHVRDRQMAAAIDDIIFEAADAEDRVIVSADTDFGAILAARRQSRPSVILFRGRVPRRAEVQAATILANLGQVREYLERGAVVVLENSRVRVRRLPLI